MPEETLRVKIAEVFPCFRDIFDRMPCPYEAKCDDCPDFTKVIDQILPLLPQPDKEQLVWYILDEIATKHSATHTGSGSKPCPICDRAVEAMRLLPKPSVSKCGRLYEQRKNIV